MKLKQFLVITLLLFVFVVINILSYSSEVFAGLQSNIFRLHILANSDTEEDQALKLAVRDKVIEYMEELRNNSTSKLISKESTISAISGHLYEIQSIAEQVIKENGYNYPVSLEIGTFYFPTKYYGNISLPAGDYEALRIKIGEAEGQNWWCSLFPPLCFIDISSGYLNEEDYKVLEENLSEEEFILVSSSAPNVKLKFKILEILNKNRNITI